MIKKVYSRTDGILEVEAAGFGKVSIDEKLILEDADEICKNRYASWIKGKLAESGTLLSKEGKFLDNELENAYSNYLIRKSKAGKAPKNRLDWKEARDYWLNDSPMARGNAFNKKAVNHEWYEFHEIHLANGKRLDSYDVIKGEIISRKATDLEIVELTTFEKYLKEMKDKYSEGTIIRTNKYNKIDGLPLKGKQILEIPDSNKNFDKIQEYINLAKSKYNIEIRFRGE